MLLMIALVVTMAVPAFADVDGGIILDDRTRPPSDSDYMQAVTVLPLDEAKQKISFLYNIPIEFLYEMTEEQLAPYLIGLDQRELVASNIVVYKITENYDGTFTQIESTYEAFLQEQAMLKNMPGFEAMNTVVHNRGWIEITSSIILINATRAEASGAFRWLQRTTARMTDVVGISLQNGTFITNSANGFHRVDGTTIPITTFTGSTFIHQIGSIHRSHRLPFLDADQVWNGRDFFHIRAQFAIGNFRADSIATVYAHQTLALNTFPTFTLGGGRNIFSISGGFATRFNQTNGYVHREWW